MSEEQSCQAALHCMEHDPFAQYLGTEIEEIRPGYARASLQIEQRHLNFVKIPHGAVVFAVADQAFAAASNTRGKVSVALNVSISFFAPAAEGSKLIAEAVEKNCGRRTSSYDVTVRDDQGRTLASFQGLAFRLEKNVADVV